MYINRINYPREVKCFFFYYYYLFKQIRSGSLHTLSMWKYCCEICCWIFWSSFPTPWTLHCIFGYLTSKVFPVCASCLFVPVATLYVCWWICNSISYLFCIIMFLSSDGLPFAHLYKLDHFHTQSKNLAVDSILCNPTTY